MGSLLKNIETLQVLLPADRKSGFCLVSSEQATAAQKRNNHQAKKTAERSSDQGGILLKQRSQEHKAIANKKSGLLLALKHPHKGNRLNCSRTHSILHRYGLGEVGWGQNSGEGIYGVNTNKWIKRGDQGKQRSACVLLEGQNSSLRITKEPVSRKVLYTTSKNRK